MGREGKGEEKDLIAVQTTWRKVLSVLSSFQQLQQGVKKLKYLFTHVSSSFEWRLKEVKIALVSTFSPNAAQLIRLEKYLSTIDKLKSFAIKSATNSMLNLIVYSF